MAVKKSSKKEEVKTDLVAATPGGTLLTPKQAPAAEVLADWGMTQQLTARDIIIPKILAMQAMSQLVVDGSAKFGEFRESLGGSVLGDEKNPIQFIPFLAEKVFVVMQEKEKKFVFHHQEEITAKNENHEFEFEGEDGTPQKWYRTTQCYCLLPDKIKAIPYLLSFRSTSARAGQQLLTRMYVENIRAGKFPASMVMQLSARKTKNDKGTFIVMDVVPSRESSIEEINECYAWVKTIRSGKAKVDHSDLEADATVNAAMAEPESDEY